jgi:WD40 repeat protein
MVRALVFSPDGAGLASADDDGKVLLWHVRSGKLRASLDGHEGRTTALAFSPDGRVLASGSSPYAVKGAGRRRPGEIKLWNVATMTELASVRLPGESVVCLVFSPDGTRLAAGGLEGKVTLWSLAGLKRPTGRAKP